MTWYGMTWHGMAWYGMTWYGMTWFVQFLHNSFYIFNDMWPVTSLLLLFYCYDIMISFIYSFSLQSDKVKILTNVRHEVSLARRQRKTEHSRCPLLLTHDTTWYCIIDI